MFLLSDSMIWDGGTHNAFPSITKYNSKYYVTLREGATHLTVDGNIRVIESDDEGRTWSSVALITPPDAGFPDLRDPYIDVTPNGKLRLAAFAIDNARTSVESYVWTTTDPTNFGTETLLSITPTKTWHGGYAKDDRHYAGKWDLGDQTALDIIGSTDEEGTVYKDIITDLLTQSGSEEPNETAIYQLKNGKVLLINRQSSGASPSSVGIIGIADSMPNHTFDMFAWTGVMEGPDIVQLDNGRIVFCLREYGSSKRYTSLYEYDPKTQELSKFYTTGLASTTDGGYGGLYYDIDTDVLFFTYYVGALNGASQINLARISRPLKQG